MREMDFIHKISVIYLNIMDYIMVQYFFEMLNTIQTNTQYFFLGRLKEFH